MKGIFRVAALAVAVFLTGTFTTQAGLQLLVETTEEAPIIFEVSNNLEMTVKNDCVIFSDGEKQTSVNVGNIKKFSYVNETETGVRAVSLSPVKISFDGETLSVFGATKGDVCRIINLSGQQVLAFKADDMTTVNLSDLPGEGVYILSIGNSTTVKFRF